jgi:hypothetical protein
MICSATHVPVELQPIAPQRLTNPLGATTPSFEDAFLGPAICLPPKRDLGLSVLDFWGEEEDLGADRQRGDCRRPVFFVVGHFVIGHSSLVDLSGRTALPTIADM